MTLDADTALEPLTPTRRRGGMPAGCRPRLSAGGASDEDGAPWAADGTLLARSRQPAWLRA